MHGGWSDGRVGKNALNHTEHQPVRQEKFGKNILFSAI